MKIPTLPSADQVLADIEPLTSALYEMMPEAVQERILPYFLGRQSPIAIDRNLFPCMLRHEVKVALAKEGINVEDDLQEEGDLSLAQLANNGLAGEFRGYHFRILKADEGMLPIPGRSFTKQAFYAQQLHLLPAEQSANVRLNLVILWTFSADYRTVELQVACPKAGGLSRASVEEHFRVPVPHPATTIRREDAAQTHAESAEPRITKKAKEPTSVRTNQP